MKIPSMPDIDLPLIDMDRFKASGNMHMHPYWYGLFSQLNTQMMSNLSNEGFVPPSQPAANIALLTQSKNGTLVYDSDNDLMKVNINGTFKTITTS